MTTDTLPYPRQMEHWMTDKLPRYPHVRVIPRDSGGLKCAAIWADYYEVHICPVATGLPDLDEIDTIMQTWPGCFRATRVGWFGEPATLTRESTMHYKIADPDWPTKARADDVYTRPMVWALIRDPEASRSAPTEEAS